MTRVAILALTAAVSSQAAVSSAQTQTGQVRARLSELVAVLPDTAQPAARKLLEKGIDSVTELTAARDLIRLSEYLRPFVARNSDVGEFFRLVAVSDLRPTSRTFAMRMFRDLFRDASGGWTNASALRTLQGLAQSDTVPLVRAVALSYLAPGIPADSTSTAIFRRALLSDPSNVVRAMAIGALTYSKLPKDSIEVVLIDRIAEETDSLILKSAIEAYKRMRVDTQLASAIAKQINRRGGYKAPRWLTAEQQRMVDNTGATMPWFMRQAAPVATVAPPNVARVRFFAFGDWGAGGIPTQYQVAAALRDAHRKTPFNFGITLGDNYYYVGVPSPWDPRWQTEYEQQYSSMGIPIFGSLGNHDYGMKESPAAEITYTGYSRTWKMPSAFYSFVAGPVQMFMIDSESLTAWQLGWLDSALAASTAPWKIVAGHKDVYSNRRSSSSSNELVAILEKHHVPLLLNGHYHTMQHHQVNGVDYVTSGAGGNVLYELQEADSAQYRDRKRFAAKTHGFAVVEATPGLLTVTFQDTHGRELYRYERKR